MRAISHYGATFILLSLYGGEVCSFIEGLHLPVWMLVLGVPIFSAMALRPVLTKNMVDSAPFHLQARRQLMVDGGLYVACGAMILIFNAAMYGFPASSGVKVIMGFAALGFFASLDLALERELDISRHFSRNQMALPLAGRKIFPLTARFSIVAVGSVILVFSVIFLVIAKDLEALAKPNPFDLGHQRFSTLEELGFICAVVAAEMVNLIYSYTRNLDHFFSAQNGTLTAVANGERRIKTPVSTLDEFGVMGEYTNRMIDALRESDQLLQLTRDVTIHSMATLAETRDNETGAHILRTQRYVQALAIELKQSGGHMSGPLTDDYIDLLFKSAPLHDIGKVGIPDAILLKPGKLTEEEFTIMKTHATLGEEALRIAEERLGTNSFLHIAREIAGGHHERWDGSGYPRRLGGESIPLPARLMAVADVYDALISKRVYKPAFSHEEARRLILEGDGTQFDPAIIQVFLAVEVKFKEIAAEYSDHQ
ncbi:MAG: HD domain-containing protein [Nitrospinae bacterium]|nr:HD domain-containing protein [Nitrospinota bacterium]